MHETYSATDIINYLNAHYLTFKQLAEFAEMPPEQIQALIANDCIPIHSHKVTRQTVFHTEIFGDTNIPEQEILYYHPSLVEWAITANQYSKIMPLSEVAKKMKSDFIKELSQALVEVDGAKEVFAYCFDEMGRLLDPGIEKLMAEQWPYIMNGTYGVCLKVISAHNVVVKAVTVAVLEKWIDAATNKLKVAPDINQIGAAVVLYDKVAAHFAPHEISKSTRDRLFNKFKQLAEQAQLDLSELG